MDFVICTLKIGFKYLEIFLNTNQRDIPFTLESMALKSPGADTETIEVRQTYDYHENDREYENWIWFKSIIIPIIQMYLVHVYTIV